MNEFKKGDKVKVASTNSFGQCAGLSVNVGEIGEIINNDPDHVRIRFDKDGQDVGCYSPDQLELVGVIMTNGKQINLTVEQARSMLGKSPEMDTLIKANFTEEELKGKVVKWVDLKSISGFYVNNASEVWSDNDITTTKNNRNYFATENQAKGVLAMAQLSQLMKEMNGDWKPDWSGLSGKHVIKFKDGDATKDFFTGIVHFLAFPTEEKCDRFLELHRELIKEYFLIYQ